MYLGLDFGTSSIKALLVDEQQRVVGTAVHPLVIGGDSPGYREQDPEHWWLVALAVIDELHAAHPAALADVRGIGLCGQMHGAVLLDANGRVLRPAILWNDTRAGAECAEFEQAFPRLRSVTGNVAMPGFTAPKLLWVRSHEPTIFARIDKVLLPKAFIRFRMTGEMIEDMSDASGSLWLDVGRRDWSDEALTATGLDRAAMPSLVEGTAAAGVLRGDLVRRWGMKRPPVFSGGAGDNAAGAVGLGATRPGSAFVSLGSSGVLWVTTDRFMPYAQGAVHAFCHAVPDTWHQMGVTLSAAASLSWWSRVSGRPEAALLDEVGTPTAPSPAMFLPLSFRRAHTAQRRGDPWRFRGPVAAGRPFGAHPGGTGRRRLLPARLPRRLARVRLHDHPSRRDRRRIAVARVGSPPRCGAGHSVAPPVGRRAWWRVRGREAGPARRDGRSRPRRLHSASVSRQSSQTQIWPTPMPAVCREIAHSARRLQTS